MHRAARGDREAQGELIASLIGGQEYAKAETVARLAAMHGNPNDLLMLSAVLLLCCGGRSDAPHLAAFYNEAWAVFRLAEGYGPSKGLELLASILTALADSGNDHAAVWLDGLITGLTPVQAADLSQFVGGTLAAAAAIDG